MTGSGPPVTEAQWLARLNGLDAAEFARELTGVAEHSPWVAAAVAASRPFADLDALHGAMMHLIRARPVAEIDEFLNLHPELGALDRTDLTRESRREQSGAGLSALDDDRAARVRVLNAAYRRRHGFPLIVAVGGLSAAEVLAQMESRQAGATETERQLALAAVATIIRRRLAAIVHQDSDSPR